MSGSAALFVWRNKNASAGVTGDSQRASPVSIRKVVSFGTLFLIIEIAGAMGKRYPGHYGVVLVSIAGGLVRLLGSPRSLPPSPALFQTRPFFIA